jgi:hypothetical protein
MKNNYVELPESFYKGLICKIHVSLNGKKATKELKVCAVKARSITFIEVDKVNRQNIFRKVDRKDIVGFSPTAICEITVRDGILPVKWESGWDSIGQPSNSVKSYGRMATAASGLASQRSKHFPSVTIQRPKGSVMDALAVSVSTRSTTNSAAGFPMV